MQLNNFNSLQRLCDRRKEYFRLSMAFTLVELLVAISVSAILVGVAVSTVTTTFNQSRNTQCLAKLRNIGVGIFLYAHDNQGEFPRSFHSCAGAGKTEWSRAVLPYLGYSSTPSATQWKNIFNTIFRCPVDKSKDTNIWSYALNVYFELSPEGDDYDGAPVTWNRLVNVERPRATILLAEPHGNFFGDHLMCHQWSGLTGACNALDFRRHGKTSNYLFVDGHVESLTVEMTFNVSKGINRWNPSKAK